MLYMPFNAGVSLKRQLLLWLLLPQLVLWLSGSFLAWRVAYQNGEKGIDQMLTQSVKALARQIKPLGDGLLVDFPKAAQDILEQDPADPLSYTVTSPPGSFLLGNAKLPSPAATVFIALGEPVLYPASVDGKRVRVALLEVDYGAAPNKQRLRVQVAQSLAVRDQIARELLQQMLLPMGLMAMALGTLVYAGVSRGLAPLKRLEAQIELAGESDPVRGATIPAIALLSAPQEVHSLASTINRLLDAVARGQSKEKQFLNDAAHQLRTPLAGLIGQSELALRECQDDVVKDRLRKVLSAAQRSAHLVHQLLQLARAESTGDMQPLNLAQLARDVAREWTGRALQFDIDLGYEGEEELMVLGNELLLREALSNLVDNALQYAGPSSLVTLHVRAQSRALAQLSIEDNGPGVHPGDIAQMFGRFWRGSDKPGGCGLGLAIVQEIARRHGGSVSAENMHPQGLRVTMTLPRR
jgi:two-component system, OmpR family, sensor histidine kinase TctE